MRRSSHPLVGGDGGSHGVAKLASREWLRHPRVGAGPLRQEAIRTPVEEEHHPDQPCFGFGVAKRARHRHAAHGADLEIDNDCGCVRFEGGCGRRRRVGVVHQLDSGRGQSSVDFIADPLLVRHDEDLSHGGESSPHPGGAPRQLPAVPNIGFVVRRLILLVIVLGVAWVVAEGTGHAQDPDAPVVIIDVHDPMDQRLLDYVVATLNAGDAHLFVLQVDAPGISSGDPSELYRTMREIPVPVVVWVGADPATAHGGAASLLNVADVGAAAPNTEIGYLDPTVVRGKAAAPLRLEHGDDPDAVSETAAQLADRAIAVTEPVPGFVDIVTPSIGQLIVGLDGREITKGDETFVLATARVETTDDGDVVVAGREVLFVKPGLWDRFLRLAARPETTLFFLIAGIAAATFEFYAAGVGVTAAVAAIAVFLAGYGLATLPIRWWAVVTVLAGLFMYTWDFQRNRLGWRSLLGTVLLLGGGLNLTFAAPQFAPSWWIVVVIVIGTALFYGLALTTIARSRFSTRTIGREHLVGRVGVAETDFDPDGIVVLDEARWRGRSQRAAGIGAGDAIQVVEVKGVVLEVEPAPESATQGVRE